MLLNSNLFTLSNLPLDMEREKLESNLATLLANLDGRTNQNTEDSCANLPLCHSRSKSSFIRICDSKHIHSRDSLSKTTGKNHVKGTDEETLGTSQYVFLYLGLVRYPNTSTAFLFGPSLEESYRDHGNATPFDSGGLCNHLEREDQTETIQEFLSRHTIPIPEHRTYLARTLSQNGSFIDYFEDDRPRFRSPVGLRGGDARLWTHEVRIPDKLSIDTKELLAIFIPRNTLGNEKVQELIESLDSNQVEIIRINSPKDEDFEQLKYAVKDYSLSKAG